MICFEGGFKYGGELKSQMSVFNIVGFFRGNFMFRVHFQMLPSSRSYVSQDLNQRFIHSYLMKILYNGIKEKTRHQKNKYDINFLFIY